MSEASVTIDGAVKSSIGKGLLILVGIEAADETEDIDWLANKISGLRIFEDAEGVMNLSVKDIAIFLVIFIVFAAFVLLIIWLIAKLFRRRQ